MNTGSALPVEQFEPFPTLYRTAQIKGTSIYVRVVAQNDPGHEASTHLLVKDSFMRKKWLHKGELNPCL